MATPDVSVMTREEAEKAAKQIGTLVQEIRKLLPGVVRLTEKERIHSTGRIRDGEADALRAVLDTVELKPAAFESLAARDNGSDEDILETKLLRNRLAVVEVLGQAAVEVAILAGDLGDFALHVGEQVKPVTLEAYAIAKPIARNDAKVRSALAPALDFYTGIVKRRRARGAAKPGDAPA